MRKRRTLSSAFPRHSSWDLRRTSCTNRGHNELDLADELEDQESASEQHKKVLEQVMEVSAPRADGEAVASNARQRHQAANAEAIDAQNVPPTEKASWEA